MFQKYKQFFNLIIRNKHVGSKSTVASVIRMNRENKLLYGDIVKPKKPAKVKKVNKESDISKESSQLSQSTIKESSVDKVKKEKKKKSTIEKPPDKVKTTKKSQRTKITSKGEILNEATINLIDSNDVSRNNIDFEDRNALISFPLLNPEKSFYVGESCDCQLIKNNFKTSNAPYDYRSSKYFGFDSISNILSTSRSSESAAVLQRWKDNLITKLGVDGFDAYSKDLMTRGGNFRKLVLNYLKTGKSPSDIDEKFAAYWNSLDTAFSSFPNFIDVEGIVSHELLKYRGLFDCISVFNGKIVLVSWKKSDKAVHSMEHTYDIPLQMVACLGALNFDSRYSFNVDEAVLVMAQNDDKKAEIFHLNHDKCLHYWKEWLNRLFIYHEQKRTGGKAEHVSIVSRNTDDASNY